MARVKDASYWRDYRARRADRGDPVRRNKPSRRRHDGFTFTDVLMTLITDEVTVRGYQGLARLMLVDRQSIRHWVIGRNAMTSDQIDAIVDYFGWERIRARRAAMRELMATAGDSLGPADTGQQATPWLPREVNREPKRHPWRASING